RKQVMDERSDAFVVLPGGFGTLEELSEMMVQRILGYTDRPIVLVNPDGFYDPLLALFDHFVEHRFAKPKHLETLHVVATVEEAVGVLGGSG
ncbi:MAG: TIGR00730 family Rossman fold protein, partial [Planctomycetota bacterium]